MALAILLLVAARQHAPNLVACQAASLLAAVAFQATCPMIVVVAMRPTFPPKKKLETQ